MAEITRRRSGELVRGVFGILRPQSDGLPAKVLLERLQQVVPPTEFEQTTYPSRPDVRRYEKIVRFSTISTVKAGWLTKSRGQWALTDEGRSAYDRFTDPEKFMREAVRLYKEWRRDQPDEEEEEGPEEETETPGASTTLEEAEEGAWAEIEAHLARMNPYDYQDLVAGLLRGLGYHVSWIAPAGPDRGVDIIAFRDPLGIEGGRIKVQVKRRADKVAVGEVRSFLATLGDSDIGLFVTTTGFTPDAEGEARQQEKRRLMLLDSRRLFDLWSENYSRIPEDQRRLLPLRAVWYLAPED